MLAILGLVAALAPAARAQAPWAADSSDAERHRIGIEPAFREYLRLKGIETNPARNWIELWAPRLPDRLSGKRGDFYTRDELKRLFGR